MTQNELQAHVHMVVAEARRPIQFELVMAGVTLRAGERPGFRDIDRALQALKRRKILRYQKNQGEKGSHGWTTVDEKGGGS